MTNWIPLSYSVMHLVLHNALTKRSATTDYFLLKVTCPFVCFFFSLFSNRRVSPVSHLTRRKSPSFCFFCSFVLCHLSQSACRHAGLENRPFVMSQPGTDVSPILLTASTLVSGATTNMWGIQQVTGFSTWNTNPAEMTRSRVQMFSTTGPLKPI